MKIGIIVHSLTNNTYSAAEKLKGSLEVEGHWLRNKLVCSIK